MKKKELLAHQLDALAWIKKQKSKKLILALDMGLGKTVIAAKTIQKDERVLVICPASLKLNWERELKIWAISVPIQIIKKKTETILKRPGITIINYDLLGQKSSKKKNARAIANYDFSGFDKVILDECHMIKNAKPVRSKISGKIIRLTPKAILLSGTPMERPIDLYVPLFSIGAIKGSRDSFGHKFGDPKMLWLGTKQVWAFRGASNVPELKKILKPVMLRMLKEDVIDLPEKDISVVALDLPVGKQEKNYSFTDIIKDPRPMGFEGLSELLHEQGISKVPLAVRHIKMRLETEHKILIVAKHTDVIESLMEKLKEFNPVKLDGKCTADQKQKTADTFQEDKNCRLLIGQIKPVGVGWTLTKAKHIIVVEPDWSFSNLMQVIDRLHRIGQKNNVTAELLTIHNSICERVLYTTLEKKGFIQEVIGL